jgi:nickel-dependent lactate racemase
MRAADWDRSGWEEDGLINAAAYAAVIERFKREGFRVGPHKAYQIARDAVRVRTLMLSQMSHDFTRRLLLNPVANLDEALAIALKDLPPGARVGVMPLANSTIPVLTADR